VEKPTTSKITSSGVIMFHTVEAVKAMPEFHLHVLFRTGKEKIYDTRRMIERHEPFQAFQLTYGLFEQVKIVKGGYGIYWNDEIDISCNELYVNGKQI
jgi:hypothetical protein